MYFLVCKQTVLQYIVVYCNNMCVVLLLFQEGPFPSSRARGEYSEAVGVLLKLQTGKRILLLGCTD
jgi:hypothetical protein